MQNMLLKSVIVKGYSGLYQRTLHAAIAAKKDRLHLEGVAVPNHGLRVVH